MTLVEHVAYLDGATLGLQLSLLQSEPAASCKVFLALSCNIRSSAQACWTKFRATICVVSATFFGIKSLLKRLCRLCDGGQSQTAKHVSSLGSATE